MRQILLSSKYIVKRSRDDENTLLVKRNEEKFPRSRNDGFEIFDRVRRIKCDSITSRLHCECHYFNNWGIPCRHVVAVNRGLVLMGARHYQMILAVRYCAASSKRILTRWSGRAFYDRQHGYLSRLLWYFMVQEPHKHIKWARWERLWSIYGNECSGGKRIGKRPSRW